MKKITYLLMLIVTLTAISCKKGETGEEKEAFTNERLTGQWKATANYVSTGAPGVWKNVSDNENIIVEFKTDGTLAGNGLANIYASFFLKNDSTITLKEKNSTVTQNYRYVIEGNALTLSPSSPIICIEGCATRYIKL